MANHRFRSIVISEKDAIKWTKSLSGDNKKYDIRGNQEREESDVEILNGADGESKQNNSDAHEMETGDVQTETPCHSTPSTTSNWN